MPNIDNVTIKTTPVLRSSFVRHLPPAQDPWNTTTSSGKSGGASPEQMEQLVGAQHHHHSISPRTPRTPTRPHPLLQHLPSNRFQDRQIHRAPPRALRVTPPFFLLLLAAVYLLASFTIFSSPAPLLRVRSSSPRALLVPMPASPASIRASSPGFFELDNGRVRVRLTNVGAAVTSLLIPDKNGAGFVSRAVIPSLYSSWWCSLSVNLLVDDALFAFSGVLSDLVLGFDSLDPYLVSSRPTRFDLHPLISAYSIHSARSGVIGQRAAMLLN
jgi:hypothetical protein